MPRSIEIPDDLAAEMASRAAARGISVEEYALEVLSGRAAVSGADLPRNGAELVEFWDREGVFGSRPDITDPDAHAREMRREADRRRRDRRPDRVTAAARCARFTAARLNVAPPTFVARPMAEHELTAHEYLERAREMLWESIQTLEEAQRVMFRAGDRYVADVWGDGVRAVIELTEKITDVSGDLTKVHIEIGRLGKRDRGRPTEPQS